MEKQVRSNAGKDDSLHKYSCQSLGQTCQLLMKKLESFLRQYSPEWCLCSSYSPTKKFWPDGYSSYNKWQWGEIKHLEIMDVFAFSNLSANSLRNFTWWIWANVKQIVEQNFKSLDSMNSIDSGSIFCFTLPNSSNWNSEGNWLISWEKAKHPLFPDAFYLHTIATCYKTISIWQNIFMSGL